MGLVWDLTLPQNEKFVLLAYADHADHAGRNVFPSIGLIARKTGYSERQVIRVTKKLVQDGWLIPDGTGPRGTNRYRIPLPAEGGDILSPPAEPPPAEGVPSARPEVTSAPAGGDNLSVGGDIIVSPEPSSEPSKDKPSVNHPPPAPRESRSQPEEEEQDLVYGFSSELSQSLRKTGVFRQLWPEVARAGRTDPEILALLRWSQDSGSETPGALFMSRLRSGASPPARYLQPPCPGCGQHGDHHPACSSRYTSGQFASFIEH